VAHRERRGLGRARPATQEHGWRFAQPDAGARSRARRAWSVAATAGVRMGMRAGTVEWQFQRKEAARVVTPLLGVAGVSNEIQLMPKVSAGDVKAEIEMALKRDAQIDADSITVETSGSTVTLRGNVGSWGEREEAEDTAFSAPGVARVNNLIEINY
jgi:osmotically-inducible protein OsmY